MLRIFCYILIAVFLFTGKAEAFIRSEGLYSVHEGCSREEVERHLKGLVTAYLPYNPIIVDIGPREGKIIPYFAKTWSKSRIIAVDWCKEHPTTHVDFIYVDAGGFELHILNSAPQILKTAVVIWTKTLLSDYQELKAFLENQGFTLLNHLYEENSQGDAIFIKSYIYDALFK
jgi:hypothetical protein